MKRFNGVKFVIGLVATGAVVVLVHTWTTQSRQESNLGQVKETREMSAVKDQEPPVVMDQEDGTQAASLDARPGFQGRLPGSAVGPSEVKDEAETSAPTGGATAEQQMEAEMDRQRELTGLSSDDELSGQVTAVDPVSHTVAIQKEAAESALEPGSAQETQEVTVGSDATVVHGDQHLSLWDLQVGDQVRIKLQDDAGRQTAQAIVIYHRVGMSGAIGS